MKVNNSRGAILLQVIAILGATLVAIFLLYQQVSMNRKEQARLKMFTTIAILQANFKALLEDPNAWAITYATNIATANVTQTHMSCLVGKTNCSGGGSLIVMNGKGGDVYSALAPTSGFTINGERCFQFVTPVPTAAANSGNDACPLRVNLTWTPSCTPPCIPTKIKVSGSFSVSTRSSDFQFPINTDNYLIPEVEKDIP